MEYRTLGDRSLPALVCIPGMLGRPEDFAGFIPKWQEKLFLIFIDPNAERQRAGLQNLSAEAMQSIDYRAASSDILELLDKESVSHAYFLGLSIGGKMVYDFGAKYPERFAGAVISD